MRIQRQSPPWGRKGHCEKEELESIMIGSKEVLIPELSYNTTIYDLEDREFLCSIIEDREPSITAAEGRDVVRVIEAIKKNSSKGWTRIN
jgi:hypothetical protein